MTGPVDFDLLVPDEREFMIQTGMFALLEIINDRPERTMSESDAITALFLCHKFKLLERAAILRRLVEMTFLVESGGPRSSIRISPRRST